MSGAISRKVMRLVSRAAVNASSMLGPRAGHQARSQCNSNGPMRLVSHFSSSLIRFSYLTFSLNTEGADRAPHVEADSERECVERILRAARIGGEQINRLKGTLLNPGRKPVICGDIGRSRGL